jgi:hypothetical protein
MIGECLETTVEIEMKPLASKGRLGGRISLRMARPTTALAAQDDEGGGSPGRRGRFGGRAAPPCLFLCGDRPGWPRPVPRASPARAARCAAKGGVQPALEPRDRHTSYPDSRDEAAAIIVGACAHYYTRI